MKVAEARGEREGMTKERRVENEREDAAIGEREGNEAERRRKKGKGKMKKKKRKIE